jgi:hypothetical protein
VASEPKSSGPNDSWSNHSGPNQSKPDQARPEQARPEQGEATPPRAPWVRWFLLGIMSLVIAAVTAGIVIRNGSSQSEEAVVNEASAELLVPNLCALNTLVEQRELAKASRYFWDRIHLNTHLIGSLLLKDHRGVAMDITRAKATVESDMRLLSPNLATSVPTLLQATRIGVRTLNLQGSDTPCAGQPPANYP